MRAFIKEIGLLFIGLIMFSLMIGNALAASDIKGEDSEDLDEDGVKDETEQLNKRVVKVIENDNKIQIRSTLKDGIYKDDLWIKVKFNEDGLNVHVKYKKVSTEDDSKSDLSFNIVFREITEYIDNNGNGIYDPSDDQTIQTIELNDFDKEADYNIKTINEDTTLHEFKITTSDEIFTAHIYIAEEFEDIGGTTVSPTQAKIDIKIKNFPYGENGSRLALYTQLESKEEYEEEDDTEDEDLELAKHEKGIETKENSFTGFFTWTNEAEVDGEKVNVVASNVKKDHKDEGLEKIYLNYPNGTEIIHDPKIGVRGIIKTNIFEVFPTYLIMIIVIGVMAIFGICIAMVVVYRNNMNPFELSLKKTKKYELSSRYSMNLTAISEDFYEIIEKFKWQNNEKEEFIQEMLALSPERRKEVLRKMINQLHIN